MVGPNGPAHSLRSMYDFLLALFFRHSFYYFKKSSSKMSGFPILDLNANNLEKVINKLKEKSFFRLQQTCHAAYDFIRSSPNISVEVDRSGLLMWDEKKSRYIIDLHRKGSAEIDLETVYGTCLSSLQFCEKDVDSLCDALIKNRITAKKPQISQYDWDFDECVKVLNAVKCSDVDVMSSHMDPYEALFESKYLKKVDIYVDGDECFAAMAPHFLPKFEEVKFRIGNPDACALDLLRIFIENLKPELAGNLKMFRMEGEWQRNLKETQLKDLLLDEFNMKIAARMHDRDQDKRTFTIELPQSFPPTANLTVVIEKAYTILALYVTFRF